MRLPQSRAQYLVVHSLTHVIIVTVLLGLTSSSLHASTPALSCWPRDLRFGEVTIGQKETMLVTVTNNGQTSTKISAVTVSNSEFSVSSISLPLSLGAGQSVDVRVAFVPTTTRWAGGKIAFATNSPDQTASLLVGGTGVTALPLSAHPASISFGRIKIGESATVPVKLTNARSHPIWLTGLQTTGNGFSTSGPDFPLRLPGGTSVTLKVTFDPQAAGLTGGSVFVEGVALNIPLTGTGTTSAGQLTINPGTLNFGDIEVGTTETLSTTLGASGGSVTISSAASSNSQFSLPGAAFPLTIPAGQTVSLGVAFTPQNAGAATGTLSFASDAKNSPASESLTGKGTAPYVILSWTPSTSQVSGYNIYRCVPANCTYTRINSSLDPDTTFTDKTVVPGTTYSYVTTAVNSSGVESGYSNPAEVQVP